jgi:uncharacterized membrane protein
METGMSSEQLRLSRLSKYSYLAREQTEAALNTIIQIMEKTQDERTRQMAAAMLLDRGLDARNLPSALSVSRSGDAPQ